jgi:NADH:ubiquinone oxidoreductase subunit 6 (subunit J)
MFLFGDSETGGGLLSFFKDNWHLVLGPAFGFGAIYALLPTTRRSPVLWGGGVAALALVLGAAILIRTDTGFDESFLFYAFSGLAILSGGMMITQKNPVHAALFFALVVLSTCGLFLLQAAPFLMAATIIVYAGAIVVTFLFVIMLAKQEGPSNADQRSREPFLASLAGCVLLASLVCILHKTYDTRELESVVADLERLKNAPTADEAKQILGEPPLRKEDAPFFTRLRTYLADPDIDNLQRHWILLRTDAPKHLPQLKKKAEVLHAAAQKRRQIQGSVALTKTPGKDRTPGHFVPGKLPASNVAAIGKTLFTDYLIPVELAATLLLVATIGAIAIAGRKTEVLR